MTSILAPADARLLLNLASQYLPFDVRDRVVEFLMPLAQPRPQFVFAPDLDEPATWWIGPAHAPRSLVYEGSGLTIAHTVLVNSHRGRRALPLSRFIEGKRPANALRNRLDRAREFVMPRCVEVGVEIARIEVHADRLLYPAVDAEVDLRLACARRVFDDGLARLRAKVGS